MAYILGSNKILSIRLLPTAPWQPLGCLTSNTITETTQMLSTTTRDNQGWATSVPGFQSYTIPFSGVQTTAGGATVSFQGIDSVKQIKRAGTRVYWKIEDVASGLIEIGEGHITSLTDAADAGDFATYDGVIEGYGQPIDYDDVTAPTAPVANFFYQDVERIIIQWTPSVDDTGVVSYRIYRFDQPFDTVSGNTLEYSDYSILNGLTYNYNVSALDSSGNESPLSNKVISGLTSKPGEEYLILESDPGGVLLLETDGSPLLLETST